MVKRGVKRSRSRSVMRRKPTKKATYNHPVLKGSKSVTTSTGLGTSQVVNLRYVDKAQINPSTAGAAAYYQFRINSIFDPNYTGTGHQPLMHDQFAAIFEEYLVLEVKYRVSFVNTGTDTYIVGTQVNDVDTTDTILEYTIEQGNAEWAHLASGSGSPSVKEFIGVVDCAKLQGRSYSQYRANDNAGAGFGNNPADPIYLNCFAADSFGDDPAAVDICVELEMKVLLRGKVFTSAS